jgi:hypothetical protein
MPELKNSSKVIKLNTNFSTFFFDPHSAKPLRHRQDFLEGFSGGSAEINNRQLLPHLLDDLKPFQIVDWSKYLRDIGDNQIGKLMTKKSTIFGVSIKIS